SLVAVLLLGGLAARRGAAGDDADAAHAAVEKVDAVVHAAGFKEDGPGVGILVVSHKGVQVKKAYGLANLATHAPLETATTLEIASVSKQMAGAAVLLLVQRGKVHVEDDVRKPLPELPAYDAQHPITIDHLSRHLSGLPDYISWEGEAGTKRPYWTNADV